MFSRKKLPPIKSLVAQGTKIVGQVLFAEGMRIDGELVGPVHAAELLELQPKAQINGPVHYKALEMHQGALIAGQLFPAAALEGEKPPLKLASNAR